MWDCVLCALLIFFQVPKHKVGKNQGKDNDLLILLSAFAVYCSVGPLSGKNMKNFHKVLLTPVMWGLGWEAILLPNLYFLFDSWSLFKVFLACEPGAFSTRLCPYSVTGLNVSWQNPEH